MFAQVLQKARSDGLDLSSVLHKCRLAPEFIKPTSPTADHGSAGTCEENQKMPPSQTFSFDHLAGASVASWDSSLQTQRRNIDSVKPTPQSARLHRMVFDLKLKCGRIGTLTLENLYSDANLQLVHNRNYLFNKGETMQHRGWNACLERWTWNTWRVSVCRGACETASHAVRIRTH